MQSLAKENQISLELSSAAGNTLIWGDEQTLAEAFSNLISNAINYNRPKGCVEITIKEIKDFVATEVKDSGIGIAEEHFSLIFDQFYRIKRGEEQKTKGTGLGLPIAKKIVEAHGGSIHVSSVVGKGSIFTVLLPKTEREFDQI